MGAQGRPSSLREHVSALSCVAQSRREGGRDRESQQNEAIAEASFEGRRGIFITIIIATAY